MNCEQSAKDACEPNKVGYTDFIQKAKVATISVNVNIEANNTFATALKALLGFHCCKITRHGWNAKSQWVAVQRPDLNSKMQCPYLYLKNASDQLVPWLPSQGDLFANDWALLPD